MSSQATPLRTSSKPVHSLNNLFNLLVLFRAKIQDKEGIHLIRNASSSPESNLKTTALFLTTAFKKNLLSIWSSDYVVVVSVASRLSQPSLPLHAHTNAKRWFAESVTPSYQWRPLTAVNASAVTTAISAQRRRSRHEFSLSTFCCEPFAQGIRFLWRREYLQTESTALQKQMIEDC